MSRSRLIVTIITVIAVIVLALDLGLLGLLLNAHLFGEAPSRGDTIGGRFFIAAAAFTMAHLTTVVRLQAKPSLFRISNAFFAALVLGLSLVGSAYSDHLGQSFLAQWLSYGVIAPLYLVTGTVFVLLILLSLGKIDPAKPTRD